MQMSAYLGQKGVPVALAVPFDARGSYATSRNVRRLLNLTHAGYGYMSRGAGFQGSLSNVDVSRDGSIDHLNIDKSARLHAQVLAAILEVVGNGSGNQPTANGHNAQRAIAAPESGQNGTMKPTESTQTPPKSGSGVTNSTESVLQH
jgi:hypothetical protein